MKFDNNHKPEADDRRGADDTKHIDDALLTAMALGQISDPAEIKRLESLIAQDNTRQKDFEETARLANLIRESVENDLPLAPGSLHDVVLAALDQPEDGKQTNQSRKSVENGAPIEPARPAHRSNVRKPSSWWQANARRLSFASIVALLVIVCSVVLIQRPWQGVPTNLALADRDMSERGTAERDIEENAGKEQPSGSAEFYQIDESVNQAAPSLGQSQANLIEASEIADRESKSAVDSVKPKSGVAVDRFKKPAESGNGVLSMENRSLTPRKLSENNRRGRQESAGITGVESDGLATPFAPGNNATKQSQAGQSFSGGGLKKSEADGRKGVGKSMRVQPSRTEPADSPKTANRDAVPAAGGLSGSGFGSGGLGGGGGGRVTQLPRSEKEQLGESGSGIGPAGSRGASGRATPAGPKSAKSSSRNVERKKEKPDSGLSIQIDPKGGKNLEGLSRGAGQQQGAAGVERSRAAPDRPDRNYSFGRSPDRMQSNRSASNSSDLRKNPKPGEAAPTPSAPRPASIAATSGADKKTDRSRSKSGNERAKDAERAGDSIQSVQGKSDWYGLQDSKKPASQSAPAMNGGTKNSTLEKSIKRIDSNGAATKLGQRTKRYEKPFADPLKSEMKGYQEKSKQQDSELQLGGRKLEGQGSDLSIQEESKSAEPKKESEKQELAEEQSVENLGGEKPEDEKPEDEIRQIDPALENSFVKPVGTDAVSTFSIDNDTASYTNVRQMLRSGRLPHPEDVRIEEMINYFDFKYELPPDDEPFNVDMELASSPWSPNHKILKIGLQARTVSNDQRPPSNLVFLIDVSGSMRAGNKLPLLKLGLKKMVGRLSENDYVAIVTYANQVKVELEPTDGSQKQKIREAIDKLVAKGKTNGSQGLQTAYQLAEKHFLKDGTNRIVLGTDGDFNVGIQDDTELAGFVKKRAQTGVFLTVCGFGTDNFKDQKLQLMTKHGKGRVYYIDSQQEAQRVFADRISGSLVTVADNVKLQLIFNPRTVKQYRLIGYENRTMAAEDFDDARKPAAALNAGDSVTALYEIVPGDGDTSFPTSTNGRQLLDLKYQIVQKQKIELTDVAQTNDIAALRIRYQLPNAKRDGSKQDDSEQSKLKEFVVKNNQLSFNRASREYQLATAVAGLGLMLRGSRYRGGLNFENLKEFGATVLSPQNQPAADDTWQESDSQKAKGQDRGRNTDSKRQEMRQKQGNEILELIHRAAELHQQSK